MSDNNEEKVRKLIRALDDGIITYQEFVEKMKQFLPEISSEKAGPALTEVKDNVKLDNGKVVKMPPSPRKEIKTSNTESYEIYFPLELMNLDYIRRILDFLQDGLKIFVSKIRGSACDDQFADSYYLLKWLIDNVQTWTKGTGIVPENILPTLQYLYNVRNVFSHQSDEVKHTHLGMLNIKSEDNVDESFKYAKELLTIMSAYLRGGLEFTQDNILILREQFHSHQKWKNMRIDRITSSNPTTKSIPPKISINPGKKTPPVEPIAPPSGNSPGKPKPKPYCPAGSAPIPKDDDFESGRTSPVSIGSTGSNTRKVKTLDEIKDIVINKLVGLYGLDVGFRGPYNPTYKPKNLQANQKHQNMCDFFNWLGFKKSSVALATYFQMKNKRKPLFFILCFILSEYIDSIVRGTPLTDECILKYIRGEDGCMSDEHYTLPDDNSKK